MIWYRVILCALFTLVAVATVVDLKRGHAREQGVNIEAAAPVEDGYAEVVPLEDLPENTDASTEADDKSGVAFINFKNKL